MFTSNAALAASKEVFKAGLTAAIILIVAEHHENDVTLGPARVPQCLCTPWSEHCAWARRSRTGAAPEAGVHGGGKRE